jgi:hypothetical protein
VRAQQQQEAGSGLVGASLAEAVPLVGRVCFVSIDALERALLEQARGGESKRTTGCARSSQNAGPPSGGG